MTRTRFRTLPGKALAIPPGGEATLESVLIVYDSANDAFGVQAQEGQLRGYVLLVPRVILRECLERGRETDELRV